VVHAIITTDTDGTIVTWNAGAEALLGYAASDAIGRAVDLVVPEQFREAHWRGFRRAMASPVIRDRAADLPVLRADGDVRRLAGRLLVLTDALGVAVGAMAIFTDDGSTGFSPFG